MIVRSTPCVRPHSTPRAPPSPERPGPRPIHTASLGAWPWTGGGFVSKFRCNDGKSGERRYAAGLRPVMALVSTHDGNMRIDAIDHATWSIISAVLTGNTYGLPDRVGELSATCGRFQIPLIEDAAHALETDIDGCPIGSFGAVSAFSLSKHFPGRVAFSRSVRKSAAMTSLDCAISSRCRDRLATGRSVSRDRRPGGYWRLST